MKIRNQTSGNGKTNGGNFVKPLVMIQIEQQTVTLLREAKRNKESLRLFVIYRLFLLTSNKTFEL